MNNEGWQLPTELRLYIVHLAHLCDIAFINDRLMRTSIGRRVFETPAHAWTRFDFVLNEADHWCFGPWREDYHNLKQWLPRN